MNPRVAGPSAVAAPLELTPPGPLNGPALRLMLPDRLGAQHAASRRLVDRWLARPEGPSSAELTRALTEHNTRFSWRPPGSRAGQQLERLSSQLLARPGERWSRAPRPALQPVLIGPEAADVLQYLLHHACQMGGIPGRALKHQAPGGGAYAAAIQRPGGWLDLRWHERQRPLWRHHELTLSPQEWTALSHDLSGWLSHVAATQRLKQQQLQSVARLWNSGARRPLETSFGPVLACAAQCEVPGQGLQTLWAVAAPRHPHPLQHAGEHDLSHLTLASERARQLELQQRPDWLVPGGPHPAVAPLDPLVWIGNWTLGWSAEDAETWSAPPERGRRAPGALPSVTVTPPPWLQAGEDELRTHEDALLTCTAVLEITGELGDEGLPGLHL